VNGVTRRDIDSGCTYFITGIAQRLGSGRRILLAQIGKEHMPPDTDATCDCLAD